MAAQGQALDAGCAASGAVAGLVAITPAAGFVGVIGAIVIGLLAGVICLWGVNGLKRCSVPTTRSTCSACMASAASSVPS
jgi:ammonia channel protein AmtB